MEAPPSSSSSPPWHWGQAAFVDASDDDDGADGACELRVEWPEAAYARSMRRGPPQRVTVPSAVVRKMTQGARAPDAVRTASSVDVTCTCDSDLASDALAEMIKRRGATVVLETVFSPTSRGAIFTRKDNLVVDGLASSSSSSSSSSFPDLSLVVAATSPAQQVVRVNRVTQIRLGLTVRPGRARFVSAARLGLGTKADRRAAVETGPIGALRDLIVLPMSSSLGGQSPEETWPRGVLLTGPPGVGKTFAVAAAVRPPSLEEDDGDDDNEASSRPRRGDPSPRSYPRVRYDRLSCRDLAGVSEGAAIRKVQGAFEVALGFAEGVRRATCAGVRVEEQEGGDYSVAVLFFDDLDSLMGPKEPRDGPVNLVIRTLNWWCERVAAQRSPEGHVLVVGAAAKPGQLHASVSDARHLDCAVQIQPPTEQDRDTFLAAVAPSWRKDVRRTCAARTTGYVYRDLLRLHDCAVRLALGGEVTAAVVDEAMGTVKASVLRGYAVETPTTRWADIGGQAHAKLALQQAVEWPTKRRAAFERFGLRATRGVLLHGPPGCSKTLRNKKNPRLARAAAGESRCAFLALSGAEVYSPYLGEAEATIRRAFEAAAAAAPAILFFDELDVLVCDRAEGGDRGGNKVEARVLSTFLNCMDGVRGAYEGVVVIAATNRPAAIDRALLRPGRLETSVFVALPDRKDRVEILQIHTKRAALASDVDLTDLAGRTRGYSGAELRGLVSEAGYGALRRILPPGGGPNAPFVGSPDSDDDNDDDDDAGGKNLNNNIPDDALVVEMRDFDAVLASPRTNRNQGSRVEPAPHKGTYSYDAAAYAADLSDAHGGFGRAVRRARADYLAAHGEEPPDNKVPPLGERPTTTR